MVEARGTAVQPQPIADEPTLHDRILAATVRCVATTGVAKTTIDDIARAASCSRATIYRAFAGGKDAILVAAGTREVERFLAELGRDLDACDRLEDALVFGITQAARQLLHHEALRFLVLHEPAVLLPMVSFDGLDPLLARAAAFAEGHLARFLDVAAARSMGEWAARVVVAYACAPDAPLDLTDEGATRHLVRTFLPPGLTGQRRPGADRTPRSNGRSGRAGLMHTTQE